MEEKDIFDNSNDFDTDLEELNNSNSTNENDEEIESDSTIREEDDVHLEQINNETEDKEKLNKTPKNYTLVYLIIICITVMASVGIFSYSNYQKEQLKQNQENERFEKEQQDREFRQTQLTNCINKAKTSRSNLWNQNCTKQSDGSCTIRSNSGVSEWIEQRYQQDLDNCYQLYGN